MNFNDEALSRRLRDIIAVIVNDIDAVAYEVEGGVAYIEGVVPDEAQRRAILRTAARVDGLTHIVACLAVEHILPTSAPPTESPFPTPVLMHYHSLS
jgi:osmotically-inducible protein OsmY